MATTELQHMVDPQVMADMISAELENAIRFTPLARVDRTLEGQPGSSITVPKFEYIGDAETVAEGAEIDMELLETSTTQFSIQKAAKGVEITDEAVLSGYGDPVGEAGNQLLMAIANKVDNDALEALNDTRLVYEADSFNADAIDEGQGIFNDEDTQQMVLIANPSDVRALRKSASNDWTRASELGDDILVTGAFGEVLGAQVIRSRKVEPGNAFLVKPGALAIYLKRSAMVEDDRDISRKITEMTADQHYGVHLYDESRAVKITFPTDSGSDNGSDNGGADEPTEPEA